jgi:hypothetical protein
VNGLGNSAGLLSRVPDALPKARAARPLDHTTEFGNCYHCYRAKADLTLYLFGFLLWG